MRAIVAATLLLVPLSASAAEPATLNTLTKKEIAEGWILLFDGKTTFGWAPDGLAWSVFGGMLSPPSDKPGPLVTTTAFSDYDLALDYYVNDPKTFWVLANADRNGKQDGSDPTLPRFLPRSGEWWRMELACRGGHVIKRRNRPVGEVPFEKEIKEITPPGPRRGHIALVGKGFIVRNVKLRPVGTKPLLNGKDLSGWKKYEGDRARAKSTFAVTGEGWLHVKDGPGDLQTEGQWDDFVLQLDCKTNGKHLNSGVFFRCLPGQYQMGYEAQVHNGFTDAGKEYALDVHDPKTHAPREKRKERFSAIDFGTGAIYRRQPARFQASKDNEWFTMTVAAHGRHVATWVNGVQVVDWTDHRPEADNARKGYYPKKGPISLQGHDPTTDLHFRNFRIAELPAAPKQ